MTEQDISDTLRYLDDIEELCDASIFLITASISYLDRYGITFLVWSTLGRNLVALRTPDVLKPYMEHRKSAREIIMHAMEDIETLYNGVKNVARV